MRVRALLKTTEVCGDGSWCDACSKHGGFPTSKPRSLDFKNMNGVPPPS